MKPKVPTNFVETLHPLSPEERVIEDALLDAFAKTAAAASGDHRRDYDAMTRRTPVSPGVVFEAVDELDVQGWWVKPSGAPGQRAILFIHGGGYALGSAEAYRGLASQVASRTGVVTLALDYPLAPEHPFPAAPDAVAKACHWLLAQGIEEIALVGDSAGGALHWARWRSSTPPRLGSPRWWSSRPGRT